MRRISGQELLTSLVASPTHDGPISYQVAQGTRSRLADGDDDLDDVRRDKGTWQKPLNVANAATFISDRLNPCCRLWRGMADHRADRCGGTEGAYVATGSSVWSALNARATDLMLDDMLRYSDRARGRAGPTDGIISGITTSRCLRPVECDWAEYEKSEFRRR